MDVGEEFKMSKSSGALDITTQEIVSRDYFLNIQNSAILENSGKNNA
jgi:hypothetical protein